jgi:hypothetical protein
MHAKASYTKHLQQVSPVTTTNSVTLTVTANYLGVGIRENDIASNANANTTKMWDGPTFHKERRNFIFS